MSVVEPLNIRLSRGNNLYIISEVYDFRRRIFSALALSEAFTSSSKIGLIAGKAFFFRGFETFPRDREPFSIGKSRSA